MKGNLMTSSAILWINLYKSWYLQEGLAENSIQFDFYLDDNHDKIMSKPYKC